MKTNQKALIGAGIAAAAGTAAFLLSRRTGSSGAPIEEISDAPDHVWRKGTSHYDPNILGQTVTIGKPAQELYEEWRDFTRFPLFMENVEQVEKLDEKRSRWTVKAPLGSSVELVTKITDDQPGKFIAGERTGIPDRERRPGRIHRRAPGRGTLRPPDHALFDPPGGIVGKASPSCSSASRRSRRAAICAASSN